MKEFLKLEKYGQLYIDRVIFETYFPILFTCKNQYDEIFICVCCQNNKNGCKWLIGKTDGANIVKMLRNEITIRQLLLEYSAGKITVDCIDGQYSISYSNSDWEGNSLYLPKKDSYIDAEDGEFDEEIDYFLSIKTIDYDTEYQRKITEKLETIVKGMEPVADALTAVTNTLANVTISSEVIHTLEVVGKMYVKLAQNINEYQNIQNYEPIFNTTISTSISTQLKLEIESTDDSLSRAA